MGKVYIVTSGEYSSYGIEKVFLDRNKAECWAGLQKWICSVEEWDIEDDNFEMPNEIYYGVKFKKSAYGIYVIKFQSGEPIEKACVVKKDCCGYTYEGTIPIAKSRYSRIGCPGMRKMANDYIAEIMAKREGI